MPTPDVHQSISADGRTVAEAEVADVAYAASLVAIGRALGADLVWAHSHTDLSPLGFGPAWGYRRLEGPAGHARDSAGAAISSSADVLPYSGEDEADVLPLSEEDESAALWTAAFCGQWGHQTPAVWPFDLPPGTRTLGLHRDGLIIGVCRLTPGTGLIDAPGLTRGARDTRGYGALLASALRAVQTDSATVESWGDAPDRVRVCEQLGLVTVEYVPGWELDLGSAAGG